MQIYILPDFDQSNAIIKQSEAKFRQIEKLLHLVWDTKEKQHIKYQSTTDVINDKQLIKSFKQEINNEMNESEIKDFITTIIVFFFEFI